MSKRFLNITIFTYILSTVIETLAVVVATIWSPNLAWSTEKTLYYFCIGTSIASAIFTTTYFKKRGFNLPALSRLILVFVSVPFTYYIYISPPSLFDSVYLLPILSVAYLATLLFYSLSFVLPVAVKKYKYLKLHGIIGLFVLAFNLSTLFIYIPNWKIIIICISLLSCLMLVFHFFQEQHEIELVNDDLLDA